MRSWMTEALAHASGRPTLRVRVWQHQGRRRPQLGVWQRPEMTAVAVMAPHQGVGPRPHQGVAPKATGSVAAATAGIEQRLPVAVMAT